MNLDASLTVREIAVENPSTVRVFESAGIDYCCGGKQKLQDACEHAGIDVSEMLKRLSEAAAGPGEDGVNWAEASLHDLLEHVVNAHHAYIRRESPRISAMLDKVVARHAAAHPEVKPIQETFTALIGELAVHMMKEENVLFPHLTRMEAAAKQGSPAPLSMFGSVEIPISRMLADHEDAGALIERIRALSGEFRAPEDACPTFRALYQGLSEFDRDLRRHVHLENNIAFPRAIQLELELKAQADSGYVRS